MHPFQMLTRPSLSLSRHQIENLKKNMIKQKD